jgi:transcriptional regulator NrdR family protein
VVLNSQQRACPFCGKAEAQRSDRRPTERGEQVARKDQFPFGLHSNHRVPKQAVAPAEVLLDAAAQHGFDHKALGAF